ncbi:MAG TPA: MFS transporter [Solirubrobacteraceae bacterium]
MYRVESSGTLVKAHRALTRGRVGPRVSSTVVLLGVCSLLTDISSEMVSAVLPLWLITVVHLQPIQYGIVDGLYQGAAAFVRLAGGFVGDRRGKHKGVAAFGYGLSAVCKLALAAVGSAFGSITAIIMLDRSGKGLRTAPRDAMISMASREEDLGSSFGVHRAMDTVGALLGPLVAFGLLAIAPLAFDTLFLVSFCFAIAGLGVIVLLVREPARRRPAPDAEPLRMRAAFALLREPRFRGLFVAATVLGLATTSDGFIYLTLQRSLDLDPALFPLLFTGTAVTWMLLAAPVGRLADRVGRGRVLLSGYVLLLAVYAVLLGPSIGMAGLFVALFLLGAYYAATDGVLMALGSGHVSETLRGSGLALLGTAVSVARLFASVLFGALWTWLGIQTALAIFAGALVVAMAVAAVALRDANA